MPRPYPIFNGPIALPQGLSQTSRPFFNRASGRDFAVRAAAEDRTEITLYDEIGFWGVTAADLRAQLAEVKGGVIDLKINSPGGDVFDGIAMYNDLLAHPAQVNVEVTGLAASAASLVAMAGNRITVASNAFLMIHNAWTVAVGNRHQMTEVAGVLAQIDGALARTYAERTGADVKDVQKWMDDETWMDGPQAKELGFAHAVAGEAEPQAAFDLSVFNRVPQALLARQPREPWSARDFERALRDAGASRKTAAALVAGGYRATTQRDARSAVLTAALERLRSTIASE